MKLPSFLFKVYLLIEKEISQENQLTLVEERKYDCRCVTVSPVFVSKACFTLK